MCYLHNFKFTVQFLPFYHNSESVEMGGFSGRFPTFRIYGTGAYLGVDLTMFRAFPEEEVARAIELSGLSALVAERGALALCGENGSALSGGERQRVSIARSLLRRSELLLADEADAALDAATDRQVTDSLLSLNGLTRIVVTHDLDAALLRRCDLILALKGGRIVESGSFDELMERRGYFYSLFTLAQQ